MDLAPTDLLARAYAAFNARDIDGVLAFMTPDVVWPNGMEGGFVHGHEAVRAYWTRQWLTLDPTVEPLAITPTGPGQWTVEVHQVVRALDGSILADRQVQHVYTFAHGLISRMDIVQ